MARIRSASLFAFLLAGCSASTAGGGAERITFRPVPRPNQSIRIAMTQDMAFDMSMQGGTEGPMKMEGKMMFAATQKVGAPDEQGRLTAELTYDLMRIDLTLNGNPMPGANAANATLQGKTFTMVYGADGTVTEVKMPPELEAAAGSAKEMIRSLMSSLPNAVLGIGDTVSVTTSVPLPVGAGMNIDSKTTFKLLSITRDGGDRIAMLQQTVLGTMSGLLDSQMTGTGTLEWNVDRGFARNLTSDNSMDLTMGLPNGGTMKLKGTIHMVMTGTAQ